MQNMIDTVLFDWDGTLIDSAQHAFIAFQKTLIDFGIPIQQQIYERIYSPNWYRMYEDLGLPQEKWKEADDRWIQYYAGASSRMMPGVEAALNELARKGYAIGIVTSGSRERVLGEVNDLKLTDVFRIVICSEDVVNRKPHPEGLQIAMKRLGKEPVACCYVGDSPDDIEMGKRARVLTIGIPGRYPASRRLPNSNPDLYFPSLEHFLLKMETLPHFPRSHAAAQS